MEAVKPVKLHRITMEARRNLMVTGVNDVVSFDEQEIVLKTGEELLVVRGEQLHVDRLSIERGELEVSGTVVSLIYTKQGELQGSGKSFVKRLFS